MKMDQENKVEWLTGKVDWAKESTECPKYNTWTAGNEFSPFTGVIVDPSTASSSFHPRFEPAGTSRLNKIVCQFLGPIRTSCRSFKICNVRCSTSTLRERSLTVHAAAIKACKLTNVLKSDFTLQHVSVSSSSFPF